MSMREPVVPRAHPGYRRLAHPLAWWLWALGLAAAASRTTNPFLLVLLLCITWWVVSERNDPSTPNVMRAVVIIGAMTVLLRVVMQVVFGSGSAGTTVLLHLPVVPLPDWAGGIRLGGPVSAEGLTGAAVEGLRLATMITVLGAANALASPRRLLRYLPTSLDDVGTTLVVGLAYTPALVEDAARVRRARRLRGHDGVGPREIAAAVPVILDGALDRALALAASMDSRGYGRRRASSTSRWSGAALLLGSVGVLAGVYGLLDVATPTGVSVTLAVGGLVLASVSGLHRSRLDRRTRYRRDPWRIPETLTVISGLGTAGAAIVADLTGSLPLHVQLVPLQMPGLPVLAVPVLLLAALPGWVTPTPPSAARRVGRTRTLSPRTEEHAQPRPPRALVAAPSAASRVPVGSS
jgi:energy-coupling factor transport system permease protein